jgi:hypothetical protein
MGYEPQSTPGFSGIVRDLRDTAGIGPRSVFVWFEGKKAHAVPLHGQVAFKGEACPDCDMTLTLLDLEGTAVEVSGASVTNIRLISAGPIEGIGYSTPPSDDPCDFGWDETVVDFLQGNEPRFFGQAKIEYSVFRKTILVHLEDFESLEGRWFADAAYHHGPRPRYFVLSGGGMARGRRFFFHIYVSPE